LEHFSNEQVPVAAQLDLQLLTGALRSVSGGHRAGGFLFFCSAPLGVAPRASRGLVVAAPVLRDVRRRDRRSGGLRSAEQFLFFRQRRSLSIETTQ